MPALPPDQWDDLRADWEAGAVKQLAERYKISRAAIDKRAERAAWIKGAAMDWEDQIDARARAKAGGVDLDADEKTQSLQVDVAASERSGLIGRHRQHWAKAAEPLLEQMQRVWEPDWAPPDKDPAEFDYYARVKLAGHLTRAYNLTVNSLLVHQEGERRAHGFDYRIQQRSEDGTSKAEERRKELLKKVEVYLGVLAQKGQSLMIEDTATETT